MDKYIKIIDLGKDVVLAHFSQCSHYGVEGWWLNLANSSLKGRDFSGWTFVKTNFENADISDCDFSNAEFICCSFYNTNMEGSNFQHCHAANSSKRGTKLPFGNIFISAKMSRSDFQSASLVGAIIAGADLSHTNMSHSDFRDVKFSLTESELNDLVSSVESGIRLSREIYSFDDYLASIINDLSINGCSDHDSLLNFVEERMKSSCDILYKALNEESEIIKVVSFVDSELISYLQSHPKELFNIRPRQFEELIAEILSSFGWDIELTPATRDGGYDIFGVSKDVSGVRTSWIIECKKYATHNKVGVDIVRQLYGVKSDKKIANALIATTSDFTKGAHEFKASRYDMDFRNYNGVIDWVNRYRDRN